jgi:hypothetical protein
MDNPNCCTPPSPHECEGRACEWYGDGEPARFGAHVPTPEDWAALQGDLAAIGRDMAVALDGVAEAARDFGAALAPAHAELIRLAGGHFPRERRLLKRARARARLSTQIRFAEAHLNLLGNPFWRHGFERGVFRQWRYIEAHREGAGARYPIFTRYTDGLPLYHNRTRR